MQLPNPGYLFASQISMGTFVYTNGSYFTGTSPNESDQDITTASYSGTGGLPNTTPNTIVTVTVLGTNDVGTLGDQNLPNSIKLSYVDTNGNSIQISSIIPSLGSGALNT